MKKPTKKINSDTFGRTKTFGYPIDIAGIENTTTHYGRTSKYLHASSRNSFLESLQSKLFELSNENGNPYSILADKEQAEENLKLKEEIFNWLTEALKRLPQNQEICIYHRFGLDIKNPGQIKSEKEIATMLGLNQSTISRNISRGLKNLKEDFNINLKKKLDNQKYR